ncbi:SusC/RagA family TonB-linked outer membrane protein [Maribellus maritimus]|uniref:SusC/RagA family TonB-linked outer membrane protein n=1 Tax=Maribellus maritimus TaxID=2870838 RepID=UPI001EEBF5EC|nr:SusC/RagA family TonB-linked outer membrane protein [Maribellus maritimus]MCG6187362.1 SusC/RagA family TonB-linked outer membrane protein [Maribellus maritimus]
MKKIRLCPGNMPVAYKMLMKMKLTVFLILITFLGSIASESYSQSTKLTLNMRNSTVKEILGQIEDQSEFRFFYSDRVDVDRVTSISQKNKKIFEILDELFDNTSVTYEVRGRQIALSKDSEEIANFSFLQSQQQPNTVTGIVTDSNNQPLPGVTVVLKGTTQGAVTDVKGKYTLENVSGDAVLVFSFVGMKLQEIPISNQTQINVTLEEDVIGLEEVVAIGYGSVKKSDLTGSVSRVSSETITERQGVSLVQSLQGSTAGLNVGQVNQAGENPNISIRGRTSISGSQNPLIVVDGVIFRGSMVDINPNDIESIDILKDASSTAIYGSQATNGVVIITTKVGEKSTKPTITYSGRYTFETPSVEFVPETPEQHIQRIIAGHFFNSRTEESGYLESNPNWEVGSLMRDAEQLRAIENNLTFDWYDYVTRDKMHTQNHNISLQQRTASSGYFVSIGYTDQVGYMLNEDYSRWNARINLDNQITDWFKMGIQSFMTLSDYSGQDLPLGNRYRDDWFDPPYYEDGVTLNPFPHAVGVSTNSIYLANADDYNKRYNMFGNIYASIKLPFIEGLTFKPNFNINYITLSQYWFRDYANSFIGEGQKYEERRTEMTNDNILNYEHSFDDTHAINATFVFGTEQRMATSTQANAAGFASKELGYDKLEAGDATLQSVNTGAWEEASLYTMGRLFYGYKKKYLFTGTIRRDGFSGFSTQNKFGTFPSASFAWVISEESFMEKLTWLDNLKIRASYGSNGNRTIGRYQTLARVNGNFNYIDGGQTPVYTQGITELASPNLKWETTTGLNLGLDFSVLGQRLWGTVEYYNNNTKNLLYDVDIPGISRFETFPDNLGKIHNYGFEVTLSSINVEHNDFRWNSSLVFSLNRDELVELLGYDNDGDGVEDDLVSEGLFIGESLNAIYDYYTTGELWQFDDYYAGAIPVTADLGSYKILDYDESGIIDPLDKHILGTSDPLFRIAIDNSFIYKNWKLSFFINSVWGNDKFYLGKDDMMSFNSLNGTMFDNTNFPANSDLWTPENQDARYQRMGVSYSSGLGAGRYIPRSFVRLQDVNLSYTFKESLLTKINLQDLRLFFNGKNLLTFTNWNGWDPETGEKISMGGRPVLKGYTFGLEVKF